MKQARGNRRRTVLDRAAYASISQLKPALDLFSILGNCERFLDIGRYVENVKAKKNGLLRTSLQSPNSAIES